jgi:hypothetical protein
VGDDLAIEVDVGFGDGGDVFEFHGTDLVRGGGGRVKGETRKRNRGRDRGRGGVGKTRVWSMEYRVWGVMVA